VLALAKGGETGVARVVNTIRQIELVFILLDREAEK
jgi:hypothetical protein